MTLTAVPANNFDYVEPCLDVFQVEVTNNLGRDVDELELVYLDGYFGEVRNFPLIADGEKGMINIKPYRVQQTKQMEATDTFVVGEEIYFLPGGSSAAGLLRATPEPGSIAIGKITAFGGTGGATTDVSFIAYLARTGIPIGQGLKVVETAIVADASAGIVVNIPLGAKIIDATVLCTAAVALETMQVKTGAGTPAVITDAIDCITDEILARAGTIDDSTRVVGADGVKIFAASAAGRGIVHVYYI